ncbi:MAG: galactokinase [Planctomycetota bacterium]|jgi:galactokinase|nr:galactokinase [Planctomycetota bacterium]
MQNGNALTRKLRANAFREKLARLYCCGEDETGIYAERFIGLINIYSERFGDGEGMGLFSSPGRTEIGGNHTDHQRGCVIAGSVNLDIAAAAAPNGINAVRMISDGQPMETVNLSDLRPNPDEFFQTSALIRGIAAGFAREGHRVGGFDIVAASSVLKGSGLSSSAAFEVLIANVLNSLNCDDEVPPVELARFGQYSENTFYGKPCGLMDQLSSAVGGVLFIDFFNLASPLVEKMDFNLAAHGYALCIIDSGAHHADLSGAYASIPGEMGRVAAFFGKNQLRDVDHVEFMNNFAEARKAAGDRAMLRALHFFHDNRRAIEESRALKNGDFETFLKLVRESGLSSSIHLQNIHLPGADREQAVDVALALCAESLGGRGACRVHGGGFAGTIQAFVPIDMLDSFMPEIDATLGKGSCHVLSIRLDGGARLA